MRAGFSVCCIAILRFVRILGVDIRPYCRHWRPVLGKLGGGGARRTQVTNIKTPGYTQPYTLPTGIARIRFQPLAAMATMATLPSSLFHVTDRAVEGSHYYHTVNPSQFRHPDVLQISDFVNIYAVKFRVFLGSLLCAVILSPYFTPLNLAFIKFKL